MIAMYDLSPDGKVGSTLKMNEWNIPYYKIKNKTT